PRPAPEAPGERNTNGAPSLDLTSKAVRACATTGCPSGRQKEENHANRSDKSMRREPVPRVSCPAHNPPPFGVVDVGQSVNAFASIAPVGWHQRAARAP